MSSGPTGTGETCISVIKKGRINLYFTREDWCGYNLECKTEEAKCKVDRTTAGEELCWHCGYMIKWKMPDVIDKKLEEKGIK